MSANAGPQARLTAAALHLGRTTKRLATRDITKDQEITMRFMPITLFLGGLLAATPVLAGWTMDAARSHMAFVTIKAKDIAEVNGFGEMSGSISDEGEVRVSLMLDSVETLIPIRNERMREFLFETADYQQAELTAKIEPQLITAIGVGEVGSITTEANLNLHGQTQPMSLSVQVARLDANTLMAASIKPLIVEASKFGLSEGVEKLREIAGLASISEAVPVSFVVTFVQESASAD